MSTAVLPSPAERPVEPPRRIENMPGRLGTWALNSTLARLGFPWRRRLSRAALFVPEIRRCEDAFAGMTEEEIGAKSMELRGRARGKTDLDILLPEAFGLGSVAIQRALGLRPFDVQLAAGCVMHFGGVVELATGEGKTLCAVSSRPL